MIKLAVTALLFLMLSGAASALACPEELQATSFEFQFETGASWSICWHIDQQAGLVLSNVYYGAPSERPRQLLKKASIGQILFKYDEDTEASHLLSTVGLGGAQFDSSEVAECDNGELLAGQDGYHICRRFYDLNHLTKVRRTESVRRHEISLHARSIIGTHQFEQVWRFSEDGELSPSVYFSGVINRYTNDERFGVSIDGSGQFASSAAVLVNWRLDFNIDGSPHNDRVDEVEFLPVETDKHAISVTPITRESARRVNPETFRGWRISDADISSGETSRIGYYLDPQTVGHKFVSNNLPWTSFDFFVTQNNPCEIISSANTLQNPDCAASLTEYVDNASLEDTDLVTWFSVSRTFIPRREDYPAISAQEIGFRLIPFDWSASSPFESLRETGADDDRGRP